jgi:protein-histidine pros-kinase
MGILLKFNFLLLALALVGLGLFTLVSWPVLKEQARDEVMTSARIMIESAAGTRRYTNQEVAPILSELQDDATFHPQSVAAYAALKTFQNFQETFPDYKYREAALNPTNPSHRATESEVDIVREFRDNATKRELLTERDTATGRVLNLSRPLVAAKGCLVCHDTPERAPQAMLAQYGRQNGFGWKENEIIGAQIVSVPMTVPLAKATKSLFVSLSLQALVSGLLILLVNLLVLFLIIRPVRRISRFATDVSMGRMNVEEYQQPGSDEVATLATSINRLKRSLDEAIKLLSTPDKRA